MQTLLLDVRFALRTLRKTPAFVAVTVLTLALGIGANLAIATVVHAVLLRPLPFREPDRLVRIFDDVPAAGARDVGMSVPELIDLDSSGVFERLSAIFPASTALGGGDHVERIELLGTSPDYFEVLGAAPALGRVYTQREWQPGFLDGVVISDALWHRQFGGDPRVIGRRIRVDEDRYTIIGVMPPDFRHPGNTLDGDVDLWAATGFVAPPFPSPPLRNVRILPGALGRLKPGVTLAEAQRRLDALAARLQRTYPDDYPSRLRWTLRVERAQTSLTGGVRASLFMLLAAVWCVLLIVCVNLASLLLARASARGKEIGIRLALGASRARIVRQVLTESLLLSVAGGTLAAAVLLAARRALVALIPSDLPRIAEVHADWRTVALAFGLSLVTGVLFGVVPAMQTARLDPQHGLREGGRSGWGSSASQARARSALVSLEVALSVVLLTGAGLLVRSFAAVLHQDPGLDPKRLVVGQIWVPVPNDPKTNRYLSNLQQATLARKLLAELASLPGVQRAALGTSADLPLASTANPLPFAFADEPTTQATDHSARFGAVSASYFAVLGTPLKRGRVFTDRDDTLAPPVAVVNEAFVRRFSRDRDAIGRRLGGRRGPAYEIIGVVGDTHDAGLDVAPEPHIYFSILQRPNVALAVFLRMRAEGAAMEGPLTRAVHAVDPELPVFGVRSMEQAMSASVERRRFALALVSVFGGAALLLAALGTYGVMAFVVQQRTPEFGLRMALGAERRSIMTLVLRPGFAVAARGAALGLAVALLGARLMSSLVFGVSARDPVTFVAVPAVLALAVLAACLVPAWRATRVSPMEALRP